MSQPDFEKRGIENPKRDFPKVAVQPNERPIDILKPGSEVHERVRMWLMNRLEDSERAMSDFHPRWRASEQRIQAYINLQNWEQQLQDATDSGEAPMIVSIVIPYSFAVINTITTFLLHTFAGRKPMFQVNSHKAETSMSARMMEVVVQYNADHTQLMKYLWQGLQDSQTYGVAIWRTDWEVTTAMRTVREQSPIISLFNQLLPGQRETQKREPRTVYEGNMVRSMDPFMFFPDPNVPMHEVSRRGEYVFWRSYEGRHALKRLEADPNKNYKWIDQVPEVLPRNVSSHSTDPAASARSIMSGGDPHPGAGLRNLDLRHRHTMQIDEGTIDIIPRELGLGDSDKVERWIFTVGSKSQIIRAEPYTADHGMHPVAVAEPYSFGYGFGALGLGDYLGPLQDSMSWLVNSHMDNVRKVLNDMLVVDPSMVEMQDLKEGEAGRLIRLKQSAFGQDVRAAINQLQVVDVTSGHMNDLEVFFRIGQLLTAVNENVLGLQAAGDRKTATEVRTTSEAAASRLAAQARIISSQAIVDLTEQMSVNIQQNLSQDFYISVVGREGLENPLRLTPDQLAGDFYYPVHDGTLPLDRVALFDVWREVLGIALQDPILRSQYDVPKLFEFVAELGGAKNLQGMRLELGSPESIEQQQQAGNIVPIGGQGGPRVDTGGQGAAVRAPTGPLAP